MTVFSIESPRLIFGSSPSAALSKILKFVSNSKPALSLLVCRGDIPLGYLLPKYSLSILGSGCSEFINFELLAGCLRLLFQLELRLTPLGLLRIFRDRKIPLVVFAVVAYHVALYRDARLVIVVRNRTQVPIGVVFTVACEILLRRYHI